MILWYRIDLDHFLCILGQKKLQRIKYLVAFRVSILSKTFFSLSQKLLKQFVIVCKKVDLKGSPLTVFLAQKQSQETYFFILFSHFLYCA